MKEMIYQAAGIKRYCLGQPVDLIEVRERKTGDNIYPSSLFYPPVDEGFLSELVVCYYQRFTVHEQREPKPDFFGYKAIALPGTSEEIIVTNNYFLYSHSVEFLGGIEPVNLPDYAWKDDITGKMYLDIAYLNRCHKDYPGLYPHLSEFVALLN